MRSGNVKDLTQAWDLYYHVFRRISKQLPQVSETTVNALISCTNFSYKPHLHMQSVSGKQTNANV